MCARACVMCVYHMHVCEFVVSISIPIPTCYIYEQDPGGDTHKIPNVVNPMPTTVVDDVLLATAEAAKQVVLDNMERISSTTNISGPKYDKTHRRWFW